MQERVTTRERYTRAVGSRRLHMSSRSMGDVEVLIASGWAGDTLGPMLYRLAEEYDLVRGDVDIARAYRSSLRSQAEREEKALMHKKTRLPGPCRAAHLIELAEQDEKRVALQARALALLKLKSLHDTALEVGGWACVMATRLRVVLDDRTVKVLAGRVLDAWIDPVCSTCHGVGKIGPRQQTCRACAGTGKRSASMGRSIEEIYLARSMLAAMDRMTDAFDKSMGISLR